VAVYLTVENKQTGNYACTWKARKGKGKEETMEGILHKSLAFDCPLMSLLL